MARGGSLRWPPDLTLLELGSAPSVWTTLAIAELLCRGTCPEVLLYVRAREEARRLVAAARKRLGSVTLLPADALQTAAEVYLRFVVSVARRELGPPAMRVYAPARLARAAQLFVGVGKGGFSVLTICESEGRLAPAPLLAEEVRR